MDIDKEKDFSSKIRKAARGSFVTLSCAGAIYGFGAAIAATATLPILARIIRAIEVTVNTSLNFGTMALAATATQGGTAVMDPVQGNVVASGKNSLSLAGGIPQVGRLTVRGAPFPISISVEDTVVALSNGVATVTVSNFNFASENGGPQVTVTPQLNQPSFTIPVGATLNAQPNQATGTYVGSTRIYANFQ